LCLAGAVTRLPRASGTSRVAADHCAGKALALSRSERRLLRTRPGDHSLSLARARCATDGERCETGERQDNRHGGEQATPRGRHLDDLLTALRYALR
jgi:hypothetical protein